MDTIAVASDHAGWELKSSLVKALQKKGWRVHDFGCQGPEDKVDYPDYAGKVARAVSRKEASIGLLCCGTGIGMSIAANKIRGIRAAVVWDPISAKLAREHNNSNVLCLGGRMLSSKKAAGMLEAFLKAAPPQEKRHLQRIKKIHKLER